MARILIVDDHPIVREGLRMVISDEMPGFQLEFAENGDRLITLARAHTYDLVTLDMNLPDMSPFQLFELLMTIAPSQKVLIYTMNSADVYGLRYLKMGAYGFLEKTSSDTELMAAIRKILNGKKYFNEEVMDALIMDYGTVKKSQEGNPFHLLSPRELEVCAYLAQGMATGELSELLHLQASTVATFKKRILQKLNVHNQFQLSELAKAYKII